MRSEGRLLFIYLWVFVALMIFRAYFGIFETNPSLFIVISYIPLFYFYHKSVGLWTSLSVGGLVLSSVIKSPEISEFIASQTYIWILFTFLITVMAQNNHEKNI